MRTIISAALAAVITAGLSYACYELWMLSGPQLRGTFAANYKFFPAIIASFLLLTFADIIFGWIGRLFGKKRD